MNNRSIIIVIIHLLCFSNLAQGQKAEPVYPGGNSELQRFLESQMIYPESMKAAKKSGKVTLEFIVTREGTVRDISVVSKDADAFVPEAYRLVSMTLWEPGWRNNGKADVKSSLEIRFNYKPWLKSVERRGYENPYLLSYAVDSSLTVYPASSLHEGVEVVIEGGQNFVTWLSKNLLFPEAAKRLGLKGQVVVRFVVEPSGMTTHYFIDEPIAGGCNEETIRLIKLLKWKPGKIHGKAVRSFYVMKIGFGGASSDYRYFPANQGGGSMN